MKKHFLIATILLITATGLNAQKYITKNGRITFYSETPIETIEAGNVQVNSALDTQTGDFVFKALMKSFEFEKALMQEHFNENYVESDKFPNATFTGKVVNMADIDFSKDGKYVAEVEGKLTIHGVTKDIRENGTFEVKEGKIRGTSKFLVKLSDYDFKIPSAVMANIAESIEVTVDVELIRL